MNFFGHAAVASWHVDHPEGVLGSMLPDFASMVRARLRRVREGELAQGVALHHETDAVFHAAPSFVRLCGDGAAHLRARGLERGSARAVAHVGTELLFDGWLAEAGHGTRAYLAALQVDVSRVVPRIEFHHGRGADRLHRLVDRLREHGVPRRYDEPAFVSDRLAQVLEPRPRLRLTTEQRTEVLRWLPSWRDRVRSEAPALLAQVRRGLTPHPPGG